MNKNECFKKCSYEYICALLGAPAEVFYNKADEDFFYDFYDKLVIESAVIAGIPEDRAFDYATELYAVLIKSHEYCGERVYGSRLPERVIISTGSNDYLTVMRVNCTFGSEAGSWKTKGNFMLCLDLKSMKPVYARTSDVFRIVTPYFPKGTEEYDDAIYATVQWHLTQESDCPDSDSVFEYTADQLYDMVMKADNPQAMFAIKAVIDSRARIREPTATEAQSNAFRDIYNQVMYNPSLAKTQAEKDAVNAALQSEAMQKSTKWQSKMLAGQSIQGGSPVFIKDGKVYPLIQSGIKMQDLVFDELKESK